MTYFSTTLSNIITLKSIIFPLYKVKILGLNYRAYIS